MYALQFHNLRFRPSVTSPNPLIRCIFNHKIITSVLSPFSFFLRPSRLVVKKRVNYTKGTHFCGKFLTVLEPFDYPRCLTIILILQGMSYLREKGSNQFRSKSRGIFQIIRASLFFSIP